MQCTWVRAGVAIGIVRVAGTASFPLMAAPGSDVVNTFDVVQAAAIDSSTLGLFVFNFLGARNIFSESVTDVTCIRAELCDVSSRS